MVAAIATAQHVGPEGHGLRLPKIGRPRRTVRPEGIPSTACLRQSLRTGSSSAKRRLEGLRCPSPSRRGFDKLSPSSGRTARVIGVPLTRSEEHTSELQSLMSISYAVFCLKKKKKYINTTRDKKHIITKVCIILHQH